jgi:hypothetical protein
MDTRDLAVYNKSRRSIYSICSKTDDMFGSGWYDEFKWREEQRDKKKNKRFRFVFEEILPNTKVENNDVPQTWDSYFDKIPDKKLRVFIVTKDSVDKYGWYRIFKDTIYNKKYLLTLEDLDKQNWEIIYK